MKFLLRPKGYACYGGLKLVVGLGAMTHRDLIGVSYR